jgi:transcriptional regulator with XRE-family HTH domain
MDTDTQSQQDLRLETRVTPADLQRLRKELGQSLAEFGLTLRRAIDPRAERGYTRQYISRLEHGQDVITPEIVGAFFQIAGVLDDVPAGVGGAVTVRVLAAPGQVPEGALIPRGAKVVRCARPGCNVLFVRINPLQRYHDPDCRRAAQEAKRRAT